MKKKIKSILKKILNLILGSILFLKKRRLFPNFYLGFDFQALKITNIENYTLTHPQKVNILYNTPIVVSFIPPKFETHLKENSSFQNIDGFKKYAAILNNVEVTGGSNVIVLDHFHALYDLKFFDIHQKIKYSSDQGICFYRNDYILVNTIKSEEKIEKAIYLGGNFSWNYFHLLFEIIIKFENIKISDIDNDIPIIADKIIFDIPQYQELFTLINKTSRKIIPIEKGKRYKVKQLYYFSCPNIIPPDLLNVNDLKAEDVLFDLSTLHFIRNEYIPLSSSKEFPKRIFISRKRASGRRNFNEDEVFDVLEKYGFKKVFPEDYSITDQISLFNNADFITGGAGAAFTNLIFCKKSAKVIYFAKNSLPFSGWSTLAGFAEADILCIHENSSDSKKLKEIHVSYSIDIKNLSDFLPEWVQTQ